MAGILNFDGQPGSAMGYEAETPQDLFTQRLRRVSARGHARHIIWVGTDEAYAMPERLRKQASRGARGALRNAFYPLSRVAAVALGFASQGLAQVARYHLQGLPDAKSNPDAEMVGQLVVAFALAMVLGYFIGLRGREYSPLKSLGAAFGVVMFHNLVHIYPHLFGVLTSPAWVNYVVTHTQPHSLVWRGISFVL